jgi:hypothetical protein
MWNTNKGMCPVQTEEFEFHGSVVGDCFFISLDGTQLFFLILGQNLETHAITARRLVVLNVKDLKHVLTLDLPD